MPEKLNILVLIGSPRNEESWTYKSIRMIEQKVLEITPADFEYIFVQKLGVPYCDGCLKCVNVGEDACPEYDKIGPVAEKMDKADGLILGITKIHVIEVVTAFEELKNLCVLFVIFKVVRNE